MTDATAEEETEPQKSSKMPMIIGLVLALVGGGGGFFAVSQGLILAPESVPGEMHEDAEHDDVEKGKLDDVAFVQMEPLTISMPRSSRYAHLRFRGELEVVKEHKGDVEAVLPRIVDVLNSYLRALEISDIEQVASLTRLRAQMLRRVQIVAGPTRVKDVLIMEFVLN
jgi:flagellar FliL protein